jgi:cyclic dehypoxanthinyl futalosine synthase
VWAGRPDAASASTVALLHEAAESGRQHLEDIASAYSTEPARQAIGRQYLRENLLFDLTPRAPRRPARLLSRSVGAGIGRGIARDRVLRDGRARGGSPGMTVQEIASGVRAGVRLTPETALTLYRSAPTALLGQLADEVRRKKHPDGLVTYIIDRNVNYTNVCVARCKFCAFYRPVGSSEGYTLASTRFTEDRRDDSRSAAASCCCRADTIRIVPLQWYEDLFRGVKSRYPDFKLHALSPPEVIHISRCRSCRCRT